MKMLSAVTAVLLLAGWVAVEEAIAEQWGHWRGPSGNGTAPQARCPTEFSGSKNVRWKTEIPGNGSSSPIVWGDRVFVTTAVPVADRPGSFDFRILCLDRATGTVSWSKTAVQAVPHEGTHETNGFASGSPCTDGEHVFAHFGSRGLFCYTMDGRLVWNRDFGDMEIRNGFGEGSSPTLSGNVILVPWDHEGPSMLYALDKTTGRTIWETPRDEPTCWATPLVAEDAGGCKQVVMNGQNAARGYDLATGRELWRCGGQTVRPCASAVAADGVAFLGSGFRGSFLGAFDLAGRGNLEGGKYVLWTRTSDTPDVASPLLSGGRLYFYKEKTGILTCVDAKTGSVHFETKRIPGLSRTYASPIAANGHVFLTDRSGTIVVIKDAPTLTIVATNDMGEGIDATPALVDNALLIRGQRHLFCIARPNP